MTQVAVTKPRYDLFLRLWGLVGHSGRLVRRGIYNTKLARSSDVSLKLILVVSVLIHWERLDTDSTIRKPGRQAVAVAEGW